MDVLDTGILYRNSKPHVRSVHAYFPSVAALGDGRLVATAVLGEAFEAANCRTHVFRSEDNGQIWTMAGPVALPPEGRVMSDASRITALADGSVVLFMVRHDRTGHPGEGLTNPETLGFVPTELLLFRSRDGGRSWAGPDPLAAPLEGPAFELCSPITVLRDGRWVLPTSTWPDWGGRCPNGIRMVALVSSDNGRTWPEYWDVMHEEGRRTFFWESKILELSDGRLLAAAWVHDAEAQSDRPNHYATSSDGGATWTAPASTGLQGQTLTPWPLPDGRVLCVYRRMDRPGLWAVTCRVEQDRWTVEAHTPLWGADAAGLTSTDPNMSAAFGSLRFGAPCITPLNEAEYFVAFWCYEDCVSAIRWYKVGVS